ncbi:chemotaxis protein MotA [Chromohalobacter marismortui]|uniref:Chemotaxis protein MotA n=2 Tax=Chromohalobacter TaxID=42054 RepID=A0A4R7NPL3_9GAMM|nr:MULTISPECIES: flagellar motor stator protein MotA [Chromohalobacter]MCI0508789.1 flagellar motor stator protein MotA [Chromohalobacter sp.]TDU22844.1 chemotaxis protein MotA [Chromohalobacter marismortui]
MLILIGYVIVIASIAGGYTLVGGHFGALFQPSEILMIVGAAVGAFIAANNGKAIKATLRTFSKLKRTNKYNKAMYMELMALQYRLLAKARRDGMLAIERDIDSPEDSAIFSDYPKISNDPLIMAFITDYLRLMVSGNMDPFEIDTLMEHEIDTFQHEAEIPVHSLHSVGDGLPAFGIVAAVMGVVHALGAADQGAAAMGQMIAQALVGTFLGILLAYGFVIPVSQRLQLQVTEAIKMLQCIRVTLMASLNGMAPQLAVEFGRKALFIAERPSFTELEDHVRSEGSATRGTGTG